MTLQAMAVLAITFSLTSCNQATTSNQTRTDNAPAAEVTANDAESINAAGTAQRSANEVSSGMPVPGTNTPEHTVVNEDNTANRY